MDHAKTWEHDFCLRALASKTGGNLLLFSDGGLRPESDVAASAWAVVFSSPTDPCVLVRAGGNFFPNARRLQVTVFKAELVAFEMGVAQLEVAARTLAAAANRPAPLGGPASDAGGVSP